MTDIITAADKLACAERELKMRQRVYLRWIEDGRMSAGKAAHEIAVMEAIVADYRAAANLQMSPVVRSRKLPSGMTLFESIASGADGQKAALELVSMLRGEAERRNQLTARFTGRKVIDGMSDDAPAIFNE